MSKYNIFQIFFSLFILTKTEEWWDAVYRYNIEDDDYGYAGASYTKIVDFYLCGKRKYQVHYLGDDSLTWSKNFSNCDPVGNGKAIDGICIHGEKSYRGRLFRESAWLEVTKECNIYDKHGFTGNLGTPLSCVTINGKDYYRVAYVTDVQEIKSSNPKSVFDRISKKIFGKNIQYKAEYGIENKIELPSNNDLFTSTIQLLNIDEVKIDGTEIKLIISNEKINSSFWGSDINNLLNKKLKKILNIDINEKTKIFENIIAEETIHGITTIHSVWKEKKITIESVIKITSDIEGIRGGYRFNFILKDSKILITKIKTIIELICQYVNLERRNKVKTILKNMDKIETLDEIMELISPHDITITQIIFLYIINN